MLETFCMYLRLNSGFWSDTVCMKIYNKLLFPNFSHYVFFQEQDQKNSRLPRTVIYLTCTYFKPVKVENEKQRTNNGTVNS